MKTQTIPAGAKSTSAKKQKTFRIGSVLPLTEKNNSENFCKLIEAACELGFDISIIAEGDTSAQKKCQECAKKYPQSFKMLESIPQNSKKILDNSDVLLFANKPDREILKLIAKNRIVPILPDGCGLENFNPQLEVGEAFTFEPENFWTMVSALIRANENFKFSYDWRNLQKNLGKVKL